MSGDELFTLIRETISASKRASHVGALYCAGTDMTRFGGTDRNDKRPLEVANGEEERLTRNMWNALYDFHAEMAQELERANHQCVIQETPDGMGCVTCLYT